MKRSGNNYWITPADDGWKAKKEGSNRASGIFSTQKQAESYARNILEKSPKGTQNRENKIRSKDTINGNDPVSIKDTEH